MFGDEDSGQVVRWVSWPADCIDVRVIAEANAISA
jgi:hypothetical protein